MANFQSTKTGQFIEDILNQFLTQQGDNSTPIYLTEGGSVHPGTLIPVTTLPSYVGMIIHSTTLADEGAVKAIYGGEAWIMHSGYFLYGAGGSTPNRNMADGGSADAIVVQHTHGYSGITGNNNVNHTHSFTTGNQSANHTHTFSGTTANNNASHTHTTGSTTHTHFTVCAGSVADDQGAALSGTGYSFPRRPTTDNSWGGKTNTGNQSANHAHTYSGTTAGISVNHTHSGTTGNQSANHTHTFSGTTNATGVDGRNANMPPFKNVFIWERIA